MKTIKWPDGQTLTGRTWSDILRAMRGDQYRHFGAIAFRLELCQRARAWSGAKVSPLLTPKRFVRALADAKMFEILDH